MKVVFMTGLLCLSAMPAFALTAEWTRNTESDMREYNMYMCESVGCTVVKSSAMLKAIIPQTAVGVNPTWPMPTGKVGAISVTAVDTSGNESDLSNVVTFDTITPGAPTGLQLRLSVSVQVQ